VIRIILPAHLRALARIGGEVLLDVPPPMTLRAVLDALEAVHPALRGTIRNPEGLRRPLLRFFACGEDLTFAPLDAALPAAVACGAESLRIVGAIAGGAQGGGR